MVVGPTVLFVRTPLRSWLVWLAAGWRFPDDIAQPAGGHHGDHVATLCRPMDCPGEALDEVGNGVWRSFAASPAGCYPPRAARAAPPARRP
jgi:hypothetical protein